LLSVHDRLDEAMAASVDVSASADAQRWDEYAHGSPGAQLYHLYGWRDVISQTFGHPTYYLSATTSSRIAGVLPLVHLKSRVFGNMLVSLPFFNYGGICAETPDVRDALLQAAVDLASERQVEFIELR